MSPTNACLRQTDNRPKRDATSATHLRLQRLNILRFDGEKSVISHCTVISSLLRAARKSAMRFDSVPLVTIVGYFRLRLVD
jgi:hypothetical protein